MYQNLLENLTAPNKDRLYGLLYQTRHTMSTLRKLIQKTCTELGRHTTSRLI